MRYYKDFERFYKSDLIDYMFYILQAKWNVVIKFNYKHYRECWQTGSSDP